MLRQWHKHGLGIELMPTRTCQWLQCLQNDILLIKLSIAATSGGHNPAEVCSCHWETLNFEGIDAKFHFGKLSSYVRLRRV